MRSATSRMMIGQREAQQIGLELGRQPGAILRADDAADQQQAGQHDVDRLGGQREDEGGDRADRDDHHQAGADHDPRRHAEDVDHRRNEDEAAADAEQDGEDPGDEAERRRGQRRDVQARGVEAPAQRQAGDPAIVALGRGRRCRRPATQPSAITASLSISPPIDPSRMT